MKSILLIGLGRFGLQLAKTLDRHNHDILAVDCDEEKVNDALQFISNAEIGHITNEAYIKSLGVRNFDICVVAVGNSFQVSLEATALLKEAGGRHIISRADSDAHAKLLTLVGADETIYPEKDMAIRLAARIGSNSIVDYFQFSSNHSIIEVTVPPKWTGKTLREIGVRLNYNLNVIAVKGKGAGELTAVPGADYRFSDGESVLIFGEDSNFKKLLAQI
jgi:trk system potassium uptake protein TrkA